MAEWSVTREERQVLRDMARKQFEYSQLPIMKERTQLWYKHNDCNNTRPLIHFETWTCEHELLPELRCSSEAARNIELQILRTILNHEMIDDDRVIPPYFGIGWFTWMKLFNLDIRRKYAEDSKGGHLGHQFLHPIKNLSEDIKHLNHTVWGIDRDGTLAWKSFVEDVIGDILPVKMGMGSLGASLSQHVVHLMGMEAMMYAMVDCPGDFHEFMRCITDDYIQYFKWLESEGLLFLNNGNDWLGQGTFGFTEDLPRDKSSGTTLGNLWLYMDSQETVSISPDMFHEFFFPYYLNIANHFGLLSYGCCEPVHTFWERSISRLSNLRKVSISPWCDEEYMGEMLRDRKTIFHRKPSPNFVGVGKELDEGAFRKHIEKTVKAARGCTLEFSFRDIYNLEGNPGKPRRAVEIVREVIDDCWE